MSDPFARILPLGDAGLSIRFADEPDRPARGLVLALKRALELRPIAGVLELVPAQATLAVHYDALAIDYTSLRETIAGRLPVAPDPADSTGRSVDIPVLYDGPDLDEVALRTGLTVAEVIELHAGRTYQVLLLGFVPGFAYLGELDPRLVLPRRSSPRRRVPPGAVAIAGTQTGIYPAATPGGWHLLGRTRLVMFDPNRVPPALLGVGDRVRFVAGTE